MTENLATRFINAYNQIDNIIRIRFELSDHIGFSEAVRRSSDKNVYLRRYESKLLTYGKLRNAIVHDSDTSNPIATPNENVVYEIEKIARLISSPQEAIELKKSQKVIVCQGDDTVQSLVEKMSNHGFFAIPVIEKGEILGVLTERHLTLAIASSISSNIEVLSAFKKLDCKSLLKIKGVKHHHKILPVTTKVDELLEVFVDDPKVAIILLTRKLSNKDFIEGVFTRADILEITERLNSFLEI